MPLESIKSQVGLGNYFSTKCQEEEEEEGEKEEVHEESGSAINILLERCLNEQSLIIHISRAVDSQGPPQAVW